MREQQFGEIVTQAADGILVIGDNGVVLFANPASAVLLGRTEAELIGASLGQPVVADESTEMGILRKSGEVVTVEMRAALITWDGAPAVLASLRDVSERIQATTRIEHLNSVLRAIRNVNQVIAQEKNPEKLIRQCCEVLTGNREYDSAWIVVGGGEGTTSLFGHSGGGDELDRFADRLRDGEWPRCSEVALATEDGLVIAAPASYCEGCPLSTTFDDSSSHCVVTALRHGDDVMGLLGVSLAPAKSIEAEERDLLNEVAGDVAFALHDIEIERRQRETDSQLAQGVHDLGERVKELNCLHAASVLVLEAHRTVEDVLQGIVDLLPSAMQHSEHACARLVFEGQEYQTNGFVETPWFLSAEIQVHNEPAGCIEVGYLGQLPASGEEPFLPEEEQLFTSVVRKVVQFIERRRAEEALRRSETEHCRAQQVAHIGHWELSSPDDAPKWSDEVFRIFGIEPGKGEPSFTSHDTIIHPEEWPLLNEAVRRGFDPGEPFDLVFRMLRPARETGWMRAIGTPSFDGNGKVVKMFGTAQDVTAQHRAEKRLKESEAFLASIIETIADPVFVKDEQFRFTLVNDALCKLMGKTRDELIGTTGAEIVPADELEHFFAMDREVLSSGKEMVDELPFTRIEGTTRTLVTKKTRYVDHNGEKFVVGVIRDITDIKRLQAQVAQADRLSSMGMLAAGVAHEINNPLSYILYNLESLTEDLPALVGAVRQARTRTGDSPEASTIDGSLEEANRLMNPIMLDDMLKRFNDALGGTRRIRDVVRGLGTFSRVGRDELVPVNLMHIIDVAINLAFNEIKYRARVVKDFGKVPAVLASEGRLSQVFLNLIINAVHAIDDGDLENNEIRVRTWLDGDEVCAEVRDTGTGIPPENLKKLFDPFFTTKKIGVGSGLGLSISKNIIEGYHGTISVQSEVGEGTSFTIRLPARTEAVEPIAAAAVPSEAPGVHGRVLIVDDEERVRSVMVRMLREHETVQAGNGAQAKKILENDQAFDVILCDMMMPEISGMDLHRWLADAHPYLASRLVFVTGGAFTSSAREYLAAVDNVRLEKPFSLANLIKIVDEVIRTPQTPGWRPSASG